MSDHKIVSTELSNGVYTDSTGNLFRVADGKLWQITCCQHKTPVGKLYSIDDDQLIDRTDAATSNCNDDDEKESKVSLYDLLTITAPPPSPAICWAIAMRVMGDNEHDDECAWKIEDCVL